MFHSTDDRLQMCLLSSLLASCKYAAKIKPVFTIRIRMKLKYRLSLAIIAAVTILQIQKSHCTESDFEFFMFENFPLNAKIFVQEIKLVKTLRDYRNKLEKYSQIIKQLKRPQDVDEFGPMEVRDLFA